MVAHLFYKQKVLVVQSCSTLWDTMNHSPPGFPVGGVLQARIQTGVGNHFLLQGIFLTQELNRLFHTADRFFTIWVTREVPKYERRRTGQMHEKDNGVFLLKGLSRHRQWVRLFLCTSSNLILKTTLLDRIISDLRSFLLREENKTLKPDHS